MGYERKRGKLAELNSLLRGRAAPSPSRGEGCNVSPPLNRFSLIVGNTEILSNVKYVITLDTDTQLPAMPRGSLWGPWRTR